MPTYVYIGHDGPGAAERRKTVRERHLAHLEALDRDGRIVFAGPLRGEDGAPRGSVIILHAEDLASARAVAEGDPYRTDGVFDRVDVHETLRVLPKAD